MIKAVLFDLDGTLVNSLSDLAAATNKALQKNGFVQHRVEEFKYFVGDGIPKMIARSLPEVYSNTETAEKVKADFFDYYSKHYSDTTTVYGGMPAIVAELKEHGIAVAVLSNKAQAMADAVVKKLYGDIFDIVRGMRDGVPGKPDPSAALAVMSELGVKPTECAIVGDSGMDVATAVNCGALPVGVLWGFRTEEELKSNGAEFIIDDPTQLLEIVGIKE